jgi:hypothetical protein
MAGEKIAEQGEQGNVFEAAALYLRNNGYKLDYPATREINEKYTKPNAEMAVFKNPSNGKYACLEIGKDQSYVALNPVRPTINGLVVGPGKKFTEPLEKMALPGGLEKRLDNIAKDLNLVAAAPPERQKIRG